MSAARWESSQKPLFVKSVWTNGYRHAVLCKDDPAAKPKRARLSARSTGRLKSGKTPPQTSPSSDSNLEIPSVQLNLAGMHRLRRVGPDHRPRPKFVKSLTFSVISRVTYANNRPVMPPTPEPQPESTKLPNLEDPGASLMERVLLWLDLAGGDRYKPVGRDARNVQDHRKRVCTAHPGALQEKHNHATSVNQSAAGEHAAFVRKCMKYVHRNEDKRLGTPTDDADSIADTSILKRKMFRAAQAAAFDDQCDEYVVSSPELAETCGASDNSVVPTPLPVTHAVPKRQVHIFMPDIPKKIAEDGSVISESNVTFSMLINKGLA